MSSFVLDLDRNKRLKLYLFMLEYMTDEHRFQMTAKMAQELEQQRSTVLKDLMMYLRELLKDYKNEVQDILSADRQLATEIEFDLRKFEEQEEELERQRNASIIQFAEGVKDKATPPRTLRGNRAISTPSATPGTPQKGTQGSKDTVYMFSPDKPLPRPRKWNIKSPAPSRGVVKKGSSENEDPSDEKEAAQDTEEPNKKYTKPRSEKLVYIVAEHAFYIIISQGGLSLVDQNLG
ncbi:NCAPD3 [Mytilus coruscus]|uniref:NCAPD3 n=1 Tax=Mytilus coruscus TaxID=42192 RepID=A0A6J8DJJ6_MYTCO|nr:NCAPD3 [Mytilus coruscus]